MDCRLPAVTGWASGFSFAHSLCTFVLGASGFACCCSAASNTVLQTIVEEDKRGRVMSLFTMAVNGLAPIGGLLAGLLAYSTGAAVTLRLVGAASVLGSLVFALHYPRLRAHGRVIYVRKGLIPDPAVAIRPAA